MTQRIIKFRAWIEKMKTMSDEVCVKWDGSFSAVVGGVNGYSTSDGGVLMQFTGLLDKNGKENEIYEGDIVLDANGEKHEVRFIDGAFKMVDANGCDFALKFAWEVVGNVYESPELLNT